jgi:hypothetical protein
MLLLRSSACNCCYCIGQSKSYGHKSLQEGESVFLSCSSSKGNSTNVYRLFYCATFIYWVLRKGLEVSYHFMDSSLYLMRVPSNNVRLNSKVAISYWILLGTCAVILFVFQNVLSLNPTFFVSIGIHCLGRLIVSWYMVSFFLFSMFWFTFVLGKSFMKR